jgi:hypothetical protein
MANNANITTAANNGLIIGQNLGQLYLTQHNTVTGEDEETKLQAKAKDCCDGLFLSDPMVDRETVRSAKSERVQGTCEWIRNNSIYRRWLGAILGSV